MKCNLYLRHSITMRLVCRFEIDTILIYNLFFNYSEYHFFPPDRHAVLKIHSMHLIQVEIKIDHPLQHIFRAQIKNVH